MHTSPLFQTSAFICQNLITQETRVCARARPLAKTASPKRKTDRKWSQQRLDCDQVIGRPLDYTIQKAGLPFSPSIVKVLQVKCCIAGFYFYSNNLRTAKSSPRFSYVHEIVPSVRICISMQFQYTETKWVGDIFKNQKAMQFWGHM